MSLDYQLEGVKDWKTRCFIEVEGMKQMHPITYAIMFTGIPCKFGNITEKNAAEIFKRIYTYERLTQPFNRKHGEGDEIIPVYLTYQDVLDHIGMRTNVYWESDAIFRKEIAARLFRDNFRDAQAVIAEHDKAKVPA